MPPQQPHPPTPQGGPQRQITPQAPHYDYGSAPHPQLQQSQSGHYDVVPALTQNPGRASGHNPYEFIVNPNTPKQSLNPFKGDAFFKKVAIFGGGIIIILFTAAIILHNSAPKGSVPGMRDAALRQQEIIRISKLASVATSGQDAKNFAVNVQLTMLSSQRDTLNYLASNGLKLKGKALDLDKDPQTDALLLNAATAGNYDTAAVQNLTTQLQTYESILQNTNKETTSPTAKKLLQSNFDTADKLLLQAKALQS